MRSAMTIAERVRYLIAKYGSVRSAARVLQVDAGYLSRLGTGEKANPGKVLLKRLGLRAVTTYELRDPR